MPYYMYHIDLEDFQHQSQSQNRHVIELVSSAKSHYVYSPKFVRITTCIDAFNSVIPPINGKIHPMLLWEKQRPIDQNKVMEIVKTYEEGDIDFRSLNQEIIIGTINGQSPKLLDGQHRLAAMILHGGIVFDIKWTDFKDEDQRYAAFRAINSNTALPDHLKTADTIDETYARSAAYTWELFNRKYPGADTVTYCGCPKVSFIELLFHGFREHVSAYSLDDAPERFMGALEHPSLHLSNPADYHWHYNMNDGNCQAMKKDGIRCGSRAKSYKAHGTGGFHVCGTHKNANCTMFSATNLRTTLYERLQRDNMEFLLMQGTATSSHPHYWIKVALSVAFPLIELV